MSILPVGQGQLVSGSIDTGDIENSLRFRASASARLSRTFGVPTNKSKWTMSFWLKRGQLATSQVVFIATISAAANNYSGFTTTDQMYFQFSNTVGVVTTQVFRDPSAWLHIIVAYDSANTTASNRVRIYVNGSEITSWATDQRASVTTAMDAWNTNARAHFISQSAANWIDGYLSRVAFVDGQALTPDSFGYFNEIGVWTTKTQAQVKAVVDADGANSFMLDFDDASSIAALGYDKSSKGNNWTPNNFSLTAGATYDHMLDVPGNSYATLNPLNTSRSTLSNANLTASGATDLPTIVPDSGDWYFEIDGVSKSWTPPAAFPASAGNYNFGQRPFTFTPPAGFKALCQRNLDPFGTVTMSGTFTGNASAEGPFVWINGRPNTLSINGNVVTFGTHADKLANGFKLRTNSTLYNSTGTNSWTATIDSDIENLFMYQNAQGNP